MKRKVVISFERTAMGTVIRARCEEPLKLFYDAAASLRGLDSADIVREGLRQHAVRLAKKDRRLKPYVAELNVL